MSSGARPRKNRRTPATPPSPAGTPCTRDDWAMAASTHGTKSLQTDHASVVPASAAAGMRGKGAGIPSDWQPEASFNRLHGTGTPPPRGSSSRILFEDAAEEPPRSSSPPTTARVSPLRTPAARVSPPTTPTGVSPPAARAKVSPPRMGAAGPGSSVRERAGSLGRGAIVAKTDGPDREQ